MTSCLRRAWRGWERAFTLQPNEKCRRRPDDSVESVGVLAVEPFLIGVRPLAALHEHVGFWFAGFMPPLALTFSAHG